jgi:hypothetical protein
LAGSRREFSDNVFAIFGHQRRSKPIRELRHVREDDERWYPQFADAAAGNLSQHAFPFAPDGQREVFLPAAEAGGLPDLRNYFLLYDRVLLEVPLLTNYLESETRHALGVDDLADAAARGRLRLLVTQPEERLPLHLLQAVQERTQNAIIGRRAASTFAMATYAARAERLEKLGVLKGSIGFIGQAIAQAMGIDRGTIERVLLEPIASRYRALEALRQNDLKALPSDFGRDTWNLVRSLIASPAVPDLELEFLIGGIMVSVANLFEAELAIANPRSPFLFPAHVVSTLGQIAAGQFLSNLQPNGYERATFAGIINKYWHFCACSLTNVRVWLRRFIGYLLVGPGTSLRTLRGPPARSSQLPWREDRALPCFGISSAKTP